MKRIIVFALLLFISFLSESNIFANSLKSDPNPLKVLENKELTLQQAVYLAQTSALKWNEDAQLIQAVTIDLDDQKEKPEGLNGKRRYWNIDFGIPDTNKLFLVTIHEGKISQASDVTRKGDTPYPKTVFIKVKDINYDSPQLLKKALKLGEIYPGKDWAKGYNFMLRIDSELNIPLMLVIGWNSDQTKMKAVGFNTTTGEYIPPKN